MSMRPTHDALRNMRTEDLLFNFDSMRSLMTLMSCVSREVGKS